MADIIFERWEPVRSLPLRMYLEALHDDYEGFRLLLRGEEPDSAMIRISFESVLAYRNLDERYYLKTLEYKLESNKGTLFKINNSDFIAWFNEQSYNIYKDENIIHYSILTPNDCVDILSITIPTVEWLNNSV